MKIFNSKAFKDRRSGLRRDMPKAERVLWEHLRNKKLGVKFRRQYGIGSYVVDFYCPKLKLAIEIDGDSHSGKLAEAYDKQREQMISSFGINTIRFANNEIYHNLERVLSDISDHISSVSEPPPTPPLKGGGARL